MLKIYMELNKILAVTSATRQARPRVLGVVFGVYLSARAAYRQLNRSTNIGGRAKQPLNQTGHLTVYKTW